MDTTRHRDESTSLLPEPREGYASYDATTTTTTTTAVEGPSRGRHRRRARPEYSFPRLAGLVVGGVGVATTIAAAVFFHDARGGIHGKNSNSDGDLRPGDLQATASLSEKGTVAPHGEVSNTPSFSLEMTRAGDARVSGSGEKKRAEAAWQEEEEEEEEETPPNVIFILVDDLGMNDMGSSSTDMAEATPFIDSLAKGGVRLTSYYTNHVCTPSRVSRDGVYYVLQAVV